MEHNYEHPMTSNQYIKETVILLQNIYDQEMHVIINTFFYKLEYNAI
jgi:hypothetical protein